MGLFQTHLCGISNYVCGCRILFHIFMFIIIFWTSNKFWGWEVAYNVLREAVILSLTETNIFSHSRCLRNTQFPCLNIYFGGIVHFRSHLKSCLSNFRFKDWLINTTFTLIYGCHHTSILYFSYPLNKLKVLIRNITNNKRYFTNHKLQIKRL